MELIKKSSAPIRIYEALAELMEKELQNYDSPQYIAQDFHGAIDTWLFYMEEPRRPEDAPDFPF